VIVGIKTGILNEISSSREMTSTLMSNFHWRSWNASRTLRADRGRGRAPGSWTGTGIVDGAVATGGWEARRCDSSDGGTPALRRGGGVGFGFEDGTRLPEILGHPFGRSVVGFAGPLAKENGCDEATAPCPGLDLALETGSVGADPRGRGQL